MKFKKELLEKLDKASREVSSWSTWEQEITRRSLGERIAMEVMDDDDMGDDDMDDDIGVGEECEEGLPDEDDDEDEDDDLSMDVYDEEEEDDDVYVGRDSIVEVEDDLPGQSSNSATPEIDYMGIIRSICGGR